MNRSIPISLGKRATGNFPLRHLMKLILKASYVTSSSPPPTPLSSITTNAILFPGQGAQSIGMARDIYNAFPNSAKQVIDEAEEALQTLSSSDKRGSGIKDLMFEGPLSELTLTKNAQPAILCHSIALLRVLEREFGWDMKKNCQFALGHSLGEYTALVATGAISLFDAVRLVRLRGKYMQETLVSVPTTMKAIIICGDHLSDIEATMPSISANLPNPSTDLVEIANINSNSQVVLSGTRSGVDYACAVLQAKGFAGRAVELPVSAPFHCALMQPAAEKLTEAIAKLKVNEPVIPVISNVTAQPMHASAIPSLLVSQMTKTVQWQRSLEYCRGSIKNAGSYQYDWTVVGPSRVLSNLLKKEFPRDKVLGIVGLKDINDTTNA